MRELPAYDDVEIRKALARALKVPSILPKVWRAVVASEEYDYCGMGMGTDTFEALIDKTRRLMRPGPGRPRGRRSGAIQRPPISKQEYLRGAVYSKHVARTARQDEAVRTLRTKIFEGRVLSKEQMTQWCKQVAPRYFDIDWFIKHRVPVVDHVSCFWNPRTRRRARPREEGARIRVQAGKVERLLPNARLLFMSTMPPNKARQLQTPSGTIRSLPGSVFGEIQDVAARLSDHYPWTEEQATLFLVTNTTPLILPLDASWSTAMGSLPGRKTMRLTIEPWVTDRSLLTVVHQFRREMQVKQTRMMDERHLRLFDFVETHRHSAPRKVRQDRAADADGQRWDALKRRWNKKHPDWPYTDIKNMRIAYLRVRKQLLGSWREPLQRALHVRESEATDKR